MDQASDNADSRRRAYIAIEYDGDNTDKGGEQRSSDEAIISLSVRAGEVFAKRDKCPIDAANTEEGFEQAHDILTRIARGVLG